MENGDYFSEIENAQKKRASTLDRLREESDNLTSTEHDNLAHVSVLWDIGHFSDDVWDDKTDEGKNRRLLINARKDAMAAKLNSAAILDLLDSEEYKDNYQTQIKIVRQLRLYLGSIFVILLIILWKIA